jgi:hypothetical protein
LRLLGNYCHLIVLEKLKLPLSCFNSPLIKFPPCYLFALQISNSKVNRDVEGSTGTEDK